MGHHTISERSYMGHNTIYGKLYIVYNPDTGDPEACSTPYMGKKHMNSSFPKRVKRHSKKKGIVMSMSRLVIIFEKRAFNI